MKRFFFALACIFCGLNFVAAEETASDISVESRDDSEKNEAIRLVMKFIRNAQYKGINHDGVYTMTAENVIIYDLELNKYEPFKSFQNQQVSTCYILNKASIEAGLEPVYSIDNETDPDKWPLMRIEGVADADENANGYRRSGKRGNSSTLDTVTYFDAEEQKKFDEKLAAEKAAGEKRLAELLEKYISKIDSASYEIFWDNYKNKNFMISSKLVEIYSREFNNLLNPSFKTDSAIKYVLNKASVAHGFEPVYSVNGETQPEKWNIARYRNIDESPNANGYRIAESYHKKMLNIENTATSYSIIRYDDLETAKIMAEKTAAGKAYLDSIGLSITLNKTQNIKLADDNKGVISTDADDYKIYSFNPEKKSRALKSGIKAGDLFVIANGKNKAGKSTSSFTTKIKIDSKTVDLSCYGGHAEIEILYAAFADAADAKNVSIQVVRNPKINVTPSTSTMYKEISIKK